MCGCPSQTHAHLEVLRASHEIFVELRNKGFPIPYIFATSRCTPFIIQANTIVCPAKFFNNDFSQLQDLYSEFSAVSFWFVYFTNQKSVSAVHSKYLSGFYRVHCTVYTFHVKCTFTGNQGGGQEEIIIIIIFSLKFKVFELFAEYE